MLNTILSGLAVVAANRDFILGVAVMYRGAKMYSDFRLMMKNGIEEVEAASDVVDDLYINRAKFEAYKESLKKVK